MPPEDCLWAKPWNGRTILSTGRRFRAALTQAYMPPKSPEEPPTDSHFPMAWEARSRKLSLSRLFEGMDDPGLFVDCVFAFRTRLPHFLAYRVGTMRLSELRMWRILEAQERALGRSTEPLKILTPLKSISNARDQELSPRLPDPREPCEWRCCAMRHPTHATQGWGWSG